MLPRAVGTGYIYRMESATAVRCPGCAYENNPYYRYCGMCGSPLRAGQPAMPAAPVQAPAAKVPEAPPPVAQPKPLAQETPRKSSPITLSGFSILGLAEEMPTESAAHEEGKASLGEPERRATWDKDKDDKNRDSDELWRDSNSTFGSTRSVHYLLEDDEPVHRVHGRMYVALVLLAIAAGTLIWHWQSNGYPWEAIARTQAASRAAKAAQVTESPAPAKPTAQVATATATSQPSPETSPKVEKAEEAGPPSTPPAESAASAPAAVQAIEPVAPAASAPDEPEPAPAPTKEAVLPPKKPVARTVEFPSQPVSTPPSVAPNEPAQFFAEGEKYLYGNGVSQDCERAQKDLRTAAAHSYSQAESLLGTMYASGHCLGRDLPAAYRWYARALRHEPGNTRIASDLEVLWSQMTPAERKAAQSSGQ
jgi:hypothetical protein